ncbi:MAG: CCA tRNA nucleotidyltransferase [Gemmatimonadota bacterium]
MRRPTVPGPVRAIARTLEEAGHETWAVGGAIRDELLGRRSDDWDLATHAHPKQVRRIFRRTVPIGMEHGTVGVLVDGMMYEVTTFRRDVETDGRHAIVAFAETIEEDLARRDFTINAVAWHPLREELFDPFGGVADMEARRLRTVGAPEERFREDYLRILRALRFAGLFGLEIDDATWTALCGLVEHLGVLSAERVRDELTKVLDADANPQRALDLYARSGAIATLYPELATLSDAVWRMTVETVAELPRGRPMLRVAALVRELAPEAAAAMLLRLRFSNAANDEAAHRARAAPIPAAAADESVFRRWLSASGPGRLPALARIELARAKAERRLGGEDRVQAVVDAWRKARRVLEGRPPLTLEDLELDGRSLISLGMKPGPHFGRILSALLEWVLDDPDRNRAELLAVRARELAAAEAPGG